MKYKLLLLFMLVTVVCQGQGSYKYKNIEVTATCKQGSVTIEPDSDTFIFKDSLVNIGVQMHERSVCNVFVKNLYHAPIIVKWKRLVVMNDEGNFFTKVNTYFMDADLRTGEDKLYKGETQSYILTNWSDDMFSKRKKNQKGHVGVSIVVNDELRNYVFDLTANPIQR